MITPHSAQTQLPVSGSRPFVPDAAPIPPTGADVLRAFLAGLVVPIGAAIGGLFALVTLFGPTAPVAIATAAIVPLGVAGMLAGTWWALIRRGGWGWGDLGFTRPSRSLWHLLWEIPLAWAASLALVVTVGPLLGVSPQAAETRGLAQLPDPWLMAGASLVIILVGPAVEEVLFRRVLLDWLRSKLPMAAAVLVSAVGFAAIHVIPSVMLYLFPLAVTMALLRIWHRTLWAPLALHSANNALATLVLLAAF